MAYVKGTLGDDVLFDTSGDDVIELFRGNDTVTVTGGNDASDGGEGYRDRLIIDYSAATAAIDMTGLTYSYDFDNPGFSGTLTAGGGTSITLSHFEYFDVTSGSGNDILFGRNLSSGAGDDLLIRNELGTIDGGDGDDTVSFVNLPTADYDYGELGYTIDLTSTADDLFNIENVIGSTGEDAIYGDAGDNHLSGDRGYDVIYGGDGNDFIDGGEGVDRLRGGAGDDVIAGGSTGYDFDTLDLSEATTGVVVKLASGTATGEGNDILIDIENVTGSAFADLLIGDAGPNTLDGNGGNDIMKGGGGDDIYYIFSTASRVSETADAGLYDQIFSTVSFVLPANVEILALTESAAALRARGNSSDNILRGNSYGNYLLGMDGADRLYSYAGNDRLDGGTGADTMTGGAGNDIYIVDHAGDTVVETQGEGTDTVYSSVSFVLAPAVERLGLVGTADVDGSGNAYANILTGNDGANVLRGFDGNDRMSGHGGDDDLFGGGGVDKMYGDDGNDRLIGGDGNDILKGGAGNDWIQGGVDRDVMTGSAGADQFVFGNGDFNGRTASSADVIRDFSQTEGDLVRMDFADANTLVNGDQRFSFIGSDAFHNVAGELRFEQIGGNTYVSADRNGDGIADLMIRLDGQINMVAADFVL